MKLVIAIVQDQDAHALQKVLIENGFGVTRLASTGGFLKDGNTTLLTGVKKDRVDEVLALIKENCEMRIVTRNTTTSASWGSGVYLPYLVDVKVGGAVVFVLDVDQFEQF